MPPEVDGILGLCQGGELDFDDDMEEEDYDDEDDEEGRGRGRAEDYLMGELFANGLFAGDKITQNTFSFYLADE